LSATLADVALSNLLGAGGILTVKSAFYHVAYRARHLCGTTLKEL
jgi:hypothetical protein